MPLFLQVNVPESISSEPAFFRLVMTEVLRQAVPLDASGHLVTPQPQLEVSDQAICFIFCFSLFLPGMKCVYPLSGALAVLSSSSGLFNVVELQKALEAKFKKFALLLKRLLPGNLRASEASQRHCE